MPDSPPTEPESGFVCDCAVWLRSDCVGEPFYQLHEGKGYCLLHFPGAEKSADFAIMLKRKLAKKEANFRGVWFPDNLNFRHHSFERDVDFEWATFNGNADFDYSTFGAKANFASAVFCRGAFFRGATFAKAADFGSARFGGLARFEGAQFNADSTFSHATFSHEVDFGSAKFRDTTFTGVTFERVANFRSATFRDHAWFFDATFKARVYFGTDLLSPATFTAPAAFVGVTFDGDTYFRAVIFSDDVRFDGTTFNANADFTSATFEGPVFFINVTFDAEANFHRAMFRKNADFDHAIISHDLSFRGDDARPVFGARSVLSLRFTKIRAPKTISFDTVELRPNWFVSVNAHQFDFINVNWNWRETNEEIRELVDRNVYSPYRRLEIACRHLAINAENNTRYAEASTFRYMAMEARRLETCRGFAPWRLNWWYWLASGYGERPFQALVVLLAMLLVFAALYTQVGFARWEPRLASEADVAIAKRDDMGAPLPLKRAVTYSLGVMTLQRPEPKPATTAAQSVVLLETILGPVQGALLALAIRRKFMR